MQQYPYDHVLYHPGRVCRSCQLLKPARSKHCRICNVCVAKQDHHCIWVMNCLGRANYVWFLAMILSLALLLTYGSYLTYVLLDKVLQDAATRSAVGGFGTHWSKGSTLAQRFDMWTWALANEIRIGGAGLLALFTAPLAWGLFLYHVYLLWAGMTTNESFKWDEWKDDILDGHVYRSLDPTKHFRNTFDTEVEPNVHWPASSSQILVNRALGHVVEFQGQQNPEEFGWSNVRSLAEIVNVYDLGFTDNVKDIFHSI